MRQVSGFSLNYAYWIVGISTFWIFLSVIEISAIYTGNQHTKFLHGLMMAYPEKLGADWTAQTVDGLPVFTFLVWAIAEYGSLTLFYTCEFLLLAIMYMSMLSLAGISAREYSKNPWFLLCVGAILIIVVSPSQVNTIRGVADQYMTRGYFQPSEFGILYLPALIVAARRHSLAIAIVAVPAVFHPAYIAISAILMAVILYDRRKQNLPINIPFLILGLLMLLLPPLDLAYRFIPSDPSTFQKANEILAFERIPQHSDPTHWFNWNSVRKLIIALAAVAVTPPGVVRAALIALLVYAICGAMFVAATGNAEVALIAPWRASILIVPVTVVLLIGAAVDFLFRWKSNFKLQVATSLALSVVALGIGMDQLHKKYTKWTSIQAPDFYEYVLSNPSPENTYLTDPGLTSFRLDTMTPQFVTDKTHPYLDTEVIEWNNRLVLAKRVFGNGNKTDDLSSQIDCKALHELLSKYPVTHLLLNGPQKNPDVPCDGLREVFAGTDGQVFKVDK